MTDLAGKTILHYKIIEQVGQGGMGVVYKALDTKLKREVAIKFLPRQIAARVEERERLKIEAQAAAALNHANIATIYNIEEFDGESFIVMEYIKGRELKNRIDSGPLSLDDTLNIAIQIAKGLEAAHTKGVVHRDIKSSNIMLTDGGDVKIMDFGLAKIGRHSKLTKEGTTLGTVAYMSPEQTRGDDIDHRSDIFSFGVLLYEMLTGQMPFKGDYDQAVIYSILNEEPGPLKVLRPDAPDGLVEILQRTLAKNSEDRYASVHALREELQKLVPGAQASTVALLKRPQLIVTGVVLLLLLGAVLFWQHRRSSDVQWARQAALPEIKRLADEGHDIEAFSLAEQAEQYIEGDTVLRNLWPLFSSYYTINSDPSKADVFMRQYADINAEWKHIGQTPIDSFRHASGTARIRIEKEGFESIQIAGDGITAEFTLVKRDSGYHESTKIPASSDWYLLPVGLDHLDREPFNDFLIDIYEVSNLEFKRFVDSGGYINKAYWKYPFLREGRKLSWEEGMSLLTDKSGKPGPATWEVQDFPDGREDYPVTGVSWYEASAYAEFAGKNLPTLFHWALAARINWSARIVPLSNLLGDGPAPRGSHQGMGPFGTFDMAGNVREWILNPSGDPEAHYLLGGGWNDPDYSFTDAFAQKAFDRSPTNGFRCITYLEKNENQARLERPMARIFRDYYAERPVSDKEFSGFLRQYAYDKTPLNARLDDSNDGFEDWVRERITFDATYGQERVIVYLFLPKEGIPPYQTVAYFPGSGSLYRTSSKNLSPGQWDFILKSGRAFLWPIYKSTYERGDEVKDDYGDKSVFYKNHVIWWANDLSRSIDYLETRDDIDMEKLAYIGYSWGGASGPIMTVVEPRFKANVWYVAGLYPSIVYPEVDPFNFLPRVTTPTLMLNGKYDFFYPYETSQKPFYEQLTLPEEHRDFYLSEGSHFVPREQLIRRTLAWLDRYLGPVKH